MRPTNPLADLSDIGAARDEDIDLASAALRIAIIEFPRLDIASGLAEIDRLAERAEALATSDDAPGRLVGVDSALFHEAGFRGNTQHYYDPRNSYLNEVLRRRLGIPITLSVLYIAVAQRVGLSVEGISFPGHFFVVHRSAHRIEYVDPFHAGARLDAAARTSLARQVNPEGEITADMLRPAPARLVLLRMLRNLQAIYARAGDAARVVAILDRILQIAPSDVEALRERGTAYVKLGKLARARTDFESYLAIASPGEHFDEASEALGTLRNTLAQQN